MRTFSRWVSPFQPTAVQPSIEALTVNIGTIVCNFIIFFTVTLFQTDWNALEQKFVCYCFRNVYSDSIDHSILWDSVKQSGNGAEITKDSSLHRV